MKKAKTFKFDLDVINLLEQLARRERRSMTSMIDVLIRDAARKRGIKYDAAQAKPGIDTVAVTASN